MGGLPVDLPDLAFSRMFSVGYPSASVPVDNLARLHTRIISLVVDSEIMLNQRQVKVSDFIMVLVPLFV